MSFDVDVVGISKVMGFWVVFAGEVISIPMRTSIVSPFSVGLAI